MDIIKDLTLDELGLLCESIGAKRLKHFYKRFSKEFAKICPGFRANKLSDEKIIELTIKNRDRDFIAMYLNSFASVMLTEKRQEEFIRLIDLESKIDKTSARLSSLQRDCDNRKKVIEEYQTKFEELIKSIKRSNQVYADLKTQIDGKQAKLDELNFDIESKEKLVAELDKTVLIATNKHYRQGQTVEGDIDDDFVYAFEEALGIENETMDRFAMYLRSAFDNNIPLLMAGPKAREIADAFSIALTRKTAAVFDCAAVNSLDDLHVIRASDDTIIAIINPFAPNFIAYIPEIVNIKGKFILALHPFAEDLKLEPRGLYNYFLPVFTELIIDAPNAIKKKLKTLKSNVEGSTEVFAEFPLEYLNGRGEKFLNAFKGDGAIVDRLRAFMGDDNG